MIATAERPIWARLRRSGAGAITACLLLARASQSTALGVLFTHNSELYPTTLRATGFNWCAAACLSLSVSACRCISTVNHGLCETDSSVCSVR